MQAVDPDLSLDSSGFSPGVKPLYKNILGTLVPTFILVVVSTMLLIFYSKDIGRAAGISAGCLIVSALLARWSQPYIVYDTYGTGLKVFGYFLHSIPLLAGVMFISIGATLKLQDDGTYKMGDSEPPFGKTTGPNAYYITGSLLIAQFLFLLYPTYVLSENKTDPDFLSRNTSGNPGLYDRFKNKFFSKKQQGGFTSSAYLDGDGMPNFQWKCTKAEKN
jgi:hypothetical protein